MNKSELIDLVADHVGGKANATKAVDTIIDQIQRAVTAGERVAISGFGIFERQERAARIGRNPATGAAVKIKKSAAPKFRPGSEFKAYVNGAKKFAKATASTTAGTVSAAKSVPAKAVKAAKTVATPPAKAPVKTPVAKAPAKTAAAKAPAKTAAKAPAAKAPAKAPAAKAPAKKAPAKKTTG